MFDRDAFEERSAIMEIDGGFTRFEAETEAAKAQGFSRWEAMRNADSVGYSAAPRDHGSAAPGQPAHHMPAVQRSEKEQTRPMLERRV